MTLYRVQSELSKGDQIIPRGAWLHSSEWPETTLAKLLAVNAISILHAPPLTALPYFDDEAEELQTIGITQADQFLEANSDEIAKKLNETPDAIQSWKATVSDWLTVPGGKPSG